MYTPPIADAPRPRDFGQLAARVTAGETNRDELKCTCVGRSSWDLSHESTWLRRADSAAHAMRRRALFPRAPPGSRRRRPVALAAFPFCLPPHIRRLPCLYLSSPRVALRASSRGGGGAAAAVQAAPSHGTSVPLVSRRRPLCERWFDRSPSPLLLLPLAHAGAGWRRARVAPRP